jgi:hypothetical protein
MPVSDEEVDKAFGFGPTKAPKGGAGQAGAAGLDPVTEPAGNELLEIPKELGRGVLKGGAITATDIGRTANLPFRYFSPDAADTLAGYAQQIPGVQQMNEFADEEYQSFPEELASGLTQGALMFLGPGELRLGNLAEQAASRNLWKVGIPQSVRGAKGRMVANPRFATGKYVAKTTGDIAEASGRGAVGGVIQDPEHPAHGAEVGAATGPIGPLVHGALGNTMARWVATHGPAEAILFGAHKLIGTPWFPGMSLAAHALRWGSSPLNKALRRGGLATANALRAGASAVPSQAYGAGAGAAAAAIEGPDYPETFEDMENRGAIPKAAPANSR